MLTCSDLLNLKSVHLVYFLVHHAVTILWMFMHDARFYYMDQLLRILGSTSRRFLWLKNSLFMM